MKGKEYLVIFQASRDGEKIIREGSCCKGSNTTPISIETIDDRTTFHCDNLYQINNKRRCALNEGSCGIDINTELPTVQQQEEFETQTDITSTRGLINLSNRLRKLIKPKGRSFSEVPGQGTTFTTEVKFPDGDRGELGWARFRDEEGALVWTKGIGLEGGASLKEGDYCVMYVDPYGQHVRLAELRDGGKKVLGIDIDDLRDLQTLVLKDK